MRKYLLILIAISILITGIITTNASEILPDDPLPPGSEVPKGVWEKFSDDGIFVGLGYLGATLGEAENSPNRYGKGIYPYVIYGTCVRQPNNPRPAQWSWYINEGEMLWQSYGHSGQDITWSWTEINATPTPTTPPYTPTPTTPPATATPKVKPQMYANYLQFQNPFCVCTCYFADVYKDGVLQEVIDLTEPNINYSDYTFNLYPGQKLTVVIRWCNSPANADYYYEWSNVQINCDGKLPTTIDCPNGVCPSIICPMLNGYAMCRVTITVKACPLCRGRFEGKDPESYMNYLWEEK